MHRWSSHWARWWRDGRQSVFGILATLVRCNRAAQDCRQTTALPRIDQPSACALLVAQRWCLCARHRRSLAPCVQRNTSPYSPHKWSSVQEMGQEGVTMEWWLHVSPTMVHANAPFVARRMCRCGAANPCYPTYCIVQCAWQVQICIYATTTRITLSSY